LEKLYGFFRAKVVDNKDPQKFGRVLIWIPDIMPLVDQTKGIWARSANNPIGGYNLENDQENYYAGTSYIPRKGSWVWIFFENNNINRPYYFTALNLENAKVLPENQVGTNYEDKWTIFKSSKGRTIAISDDPSDARIEITGKKRTLTNPPSGDTASVYTIDGNQTTILLDERTGKEKILIRTHKGDFFHIDIDQQKLQASFKNDIEIKTGGALIITATKDIHLKSEAGHVRVLSNGGKVHVKAATGIRLTTGGSIHQASVFNHRVQAGLNASTSAGGTISHDGKLVQDNCGTSTTAKQAKAAITANPQGQRNT
jgi:hypothetical protein